MGQSTCRLPLGPPHLCRACCCLRIARSPCPDPNRRSTTTEPVDRRRRPSIPTNGPEPNCFEGEPVNCATGNQTEEQTDLVLGGRGPSLYLTRSYNSQGAAEAKEAGAWGYGWSGPYSSHLEFNAESGTVTVVQENGATATFNLEGGKYVPDAWILATLVKEGDKLRLHLAQPRKAQVQLRRQADRSQKDRNGNAITLSYESGKLTKVKDAAGRELVFAYTGAQVTSVEDPMGHKVKYAYESSNLISVTLPGEETPRWKFKYDASHQLTEMTDGRGGVTKTEYDEKNRVKKQTDPMERVIKFEYGESGGNKNDDHHRAKRVDHVRDVQRSRRAAGSDQGPRHKPRTENDQRIRRSL